MDKYIDGVEVPNFDAKVSETIESNELALERNGRMLIGFINNEYVVYRQIRVMDGLPNFLKAIAAFTSQGFVDELEKASGPVQGFDVLFKYVGK
ncbi:hypothetical protein [Shewanella subflava]|uniref:Uncharacterized protein n=1 Tax=Shewanella subflava TaxID=2986476 RepID=A0ABT3I5E1_9GAMM|nr:hypothetical protein [Shewanella subflava]MCW3171238.1 hypothetical protein [Shewanella subflava]